MLEPLVSTISYEWRIGVGKTKLSIELAKKYNGEIINADVMQMYKGVNVATAKVWIEMYSLIIGYFRGKRRNSTSFDWFRFSKRRNYYSWF